MFFVGPHVSISGGVRNAPPNARRYGATGFGMFVKNQRQWVAAPLQEEEIAAFKQALKENGYTPDQILPHAGYLINLANPDEALHEKSMNSLHDELSRCSSLGLKMLNLHPGSHLRKLTPEAACDRVAKSINRALADTVGVTVVIENTAGSGGNLGANFDELARIIGGVDDKSRIGFCIDTAHTFASGYDISTRTGFLRVAEELDRKVGLSYLRGMHLNDSKVGLNSRVDRHETLGNGTIGFEVFETIMGDERFSSIPLVLETPDESLWTEEIARLLGGTK